MTDSNNPSHPIPDVTAELTSIASTLEQISGRIGHLADDLSAKGQDSLATELFEVERLVGGGTRRLSKLVL